jgi:spermidine synthase
MSVIKLVALALVSGAVLAYELFVMRVFSNGGWSHFGSTVIAIAMFGFGVFSTVLCIWKDAFKRRLGGWAAAALLLIGPTMVLANSAAQQVPFNPIFLVSDPRQKYYLAAYFLLYFVPFLLGAMFLGLFFLMGQREFGRAYFANMAGAGLGGMILFFAMYLLRPENLLVVPLVLWATGALLWLMEQGGRKSLLVPALCAAVAFAGTVGLEQIRVSPFKGVSYARQFPDARRVCRKASPFGFLEVYSSSYFHFAPGLSDAATLYMDAMPQNAFLGMYIDGDGPIGIMRHLPPGQSEYVKYLSMALPYGLKAKPEVLVMQFGGGISTNVALELGARSVTVAEGNPLVAQVIRDDPFVCDFTGRILADERVRLVETEGRLLVGRLADRFDVIDLSLADSTGLSMPAGVSIHEMYGYTVETFRSCVRALRKGGIFSVTVWNKEDPPKSVLKLMSTLIEAVGASGSIDVSRELFMTQTYLSTFTVLYKKGGFRQEEVTALSDACRRLSFEVVYAPGLVGEPENIDEILSAYRSIYFPVSEKDSGEGEPPSDVDVSAGSLLRAAAHRMIRGDAASIREGYVFDIKPLTDDRPYFAGFVKLSDIPRFLDKLETISDEWGYLLLWATLVLSLFFGMLLLALPVLCGWRTLFSHEPGKLSVLVYFLCLGLGYILIEIAFISKCILCLGNSTVSFSVLVTGMLLFSGIGSYVSVRVIPVARRAIVAVCSLIGTILVLYAVGLNPLLTTIGGWSYAAKALVCLALLAPLAFLLGFPFALGMATLSSLHKEHFFVWAWGINGSFSVVGSVLVPVLSVLFGLSSVLLVSAGIYLVAAPCFLGFSRPSPARGSMS